MKKTSSTVSKELIFERFSISFLKFFPFHWKFNTNTKLEKENPKNKTKNKKKFANLETEESKIYENENKKIMHFPHKSRKKKSNLIWNYSCQTSIGE